MNDINASIREMLKAVDDGDEAAFNNIASSALNFHNPIMAEKKSAMLDAFNKFRKSWKEFDASKREYNRTMNLISHARTGKTDKYEPVHDIEKSINIIASKIGVVQLD